MKTYKELVYLRDNASLVDAPHNVISELAEELLFIKRRAALWDDLKYSLERNIKHEDRADKNTLEMVLTQMSNMEYLSTKDAQNTHSEQ